MTTTILKRKHTFRPRFFRPLPLPMRTLTWLLIVLQLALPVLPQMIYAASIPVQMPTASDKPAPTPEIKVNRTLPTVTPVATEFVFSDSPSDAEISQCHAFGLTLTPIGVTTPAENKALAQALTEFRQRKNSDDVQMLTDFLDAYPTSAWRASLLLNLGILYRHTGWFTKALDSWEQSWALAKDETKPSYKEIADESVSELLELNARLGRYDRLQTLFTEISGRQIDASLSTKIAGARQGLWLMQNRPEDAFRCGPMALAQIGPPKGISPGDFSEKIHRSRSTLQGMSLTSVCELANSLGMKYQMAWRSPGSAIVLPAVIHWKAGHYAALIKKEGGNYLIEDPTFGDSIWVSQDALNAEGSGYCLIPAGQLPSGWRSVSASEGNEIFGKGNTGTSDPSRTGCGDQKSGCNCGNNGGTPMAQYAIHLMLVSLNIVDTPVGYTPPLGPDAHFQIFYNQKEAYPPSATPPSNFGYANFGAQWTFGWMSYIVDDPVHTANDAYCFKQGGGYDTYTGFNSSNQTYAVQPDSGALLIRTSSSTYELDLPDGSKKIYGQSDGSGSYPRRIYLTQIKDPTGNTETFTYNSVAAGLQLVAVTDAIGQVTTITNELVSDPLKITKITDPFGRSATFKYNASGQLTNITDIIGITSAFTYDTNGTVVSLTTPYGTTTFAYGQNGRNAWIEATDPLGAKERVEYVDVIDSSQITDNNAPRPTTISGSDPAPSYNPTRNTFYWDKRAMSLYPYDYTKAKIYHWCHSADINTCSGIIESTKNALESRIWNTYPGQPANNTYQIGTNNLPATIARVLDDGTSQVYRYKYNLIGRPTVVVDPSNRTNLLIYDTNNIDLLAIGQLVSGVTNLLAQLSYNSQHRPLTLTDAAGQTNFYDYNSYGQLIAMTNALNEITLFKYDVNGYLTNVVTGTATQLLRTNSFTYDAYGRVHTATDPLNYTLTYSYDVADRVTNVTYPDGTYERVVYNYLDPVLQRDRNGHWTTMAYDPLRRMTDTYDNLGRHTQFGWCTCGSLESITDPMGNITSWVRDVEGRVTSKIYADLTAINYSYETNTSRLKMVTDAKSQKTQYQYYVDNNLKQVSYTNTAIATPTVSFTYDTNFNRVVTMIDGTGTTTYRYYDIAAGQFGAGKLSSVSNSFIGSTSLITYNYDALNRVTNRAINGMSQQLTFDALHRVTMVTNVLGSFTNVYMGATALIATNFYPNGQQTVFSYQSDERLSEILNLNTGGSTLSKFDYAYDPVGNITNWTQQADAATPNAYAFGYDAGNQVIDAVLQSTGVGASILKHYAYGYDLNGNRTGEQIGSTTNAPVSISQSRYNNVNQVTNRTVGSGQLMFAGSLDKQGTVTVNGVAATMNHFTTNFVGFAGVTGGTNVVPLIATDYGNHSRTNKYQVVVTNNGVAETLKYDLNGNLTNIVTATSTNSYQWDAANRLVSITGPTNQSLFTYDGLGRRVQIIEKTNGVAYITNKFIWCDKQICEQRDLTGTNVTKRFFGEGEQINGTNYYFTRDHLGSVREMTDAGGTIQARYDYDPYGRRTKLSGTMDADFGYARMYLHFPSGLSLTLYRAYSGDLGRWLSRDPIREFGGLNLYVYTLNNPIIFVDVFGLNINWSGVGLDVLGIGLGVLGVIVGAGTSEFGIGLIIGAEGAYGLAASVGNLGTDLGGGGQTMPTGLGEGIGTALGGEGSGWAKAGEIGDLGADLLGHPGVELTPFGNGLNNLGGGLDALNGYNNATNGGLLNGLKQMLAPLLGPGCPAGSGPSTGNDQNDLWNYIAQLDVLDSLPLPVL